jgi:hypothetical protein
MKTTIASVTLILAACTTSQPLYTPDGHAGQAIRCAGTINSWNGCYQRAGEICGKRGYDILQQSGENGFVASGDFASTTNNRTMVIKCKGD